MQAAQPAQPWAPVAAAMLGVLSAHPLTGLLRFAAFPLSPPQPREGGLAKAKQLSGPFG